MSYFIRILGTQDPDIHLDDILESLEEYRLTASFRLLKSEKPETWTRFDLVNKADQVLAVVERNPIKEGTLGKDELDEFKETILDFKPLTAAKWLNDFFKKVRVIYCFELMEIGLEEVNYPIITSTQSYIWEQVKGILQADDEGFSNEEGYHILWQFSDDVEGPWNCAVLNAEGKWENFCMELGDEQQQQAFLSGNVPAQAKRL
jgi:hypothetical protein